MIKSGIYKITNLINQKIYVGSAIALKKREYAHYNALKNNKHCNRKLQNSFNKYGLESFKFEIIEYIENKENLISREQHYIDTLNPYFNIRKIADSNLGIKLTKETRDKMSKASKGKVSKNKGIPMSQEQKDKIGKANAGKIRSNEAKLNMSNGKIGCVFSKEARENMSKSAIGKNLGKKASEETKLKMRIAKLGKKQSQEHIRNMVEAKIGYAIKQRKPINQLDLITDELIKEWGSIKEASLSLNISFGNISSVCNGKHNRSKAGGFNWKFKQTSIYG